MKVPQCWRRSFVLTVTLAAVAACRPLAAPQERTAEVPRPVTVMMLSKTTPTNSETVTGSVDAFKTEEIAFEVPGRVSQVIEPERDIEGRTFDSTGERLVIEGTVLARLDDERYQIAVNAAEAAVAVAKRRMEALQVDITDRIPARRASLDAEYEYARSEHDRSKSLLPNNAISREQYDRKRTDLATAAAAITTLEAERKSLGADLLSREADYQRAQHELDDAKLNLRHATLYSSFRGQVAEVHVVQGSHVEAGDPVVTVQMMDPVKVEFEVSSEMSRKYRTGDTVRVFTMDAPQPRLDLVGMVYMTDAVADPRTKTFTVTLLVRNDRTKLEIPSELDATHVARTREIWPLRAGPVIGTGSLLLMEENSIRHDDEGAFLWRITNRFVGQMWNSTRVLEVTKVRIKRDDWSVPFLNWRFVPFTFEPPTDFDLQTAFFAGALDVDQGTADEWRGTQVLHDDTDWQLRPGDIVRVDTTQQNVPEGTYVPVKAICHESDTTSVFVVAADDELGDVARRVEVRLIDVGYSAGGSDTLRRVEPHLAHEKLDGALLIVDGVHFLEDGDSVRPLPHED